VRLARPYRDPQALPNASEHAKLFGGGIVKKHITRPGREGLLHLRSLEARSGMNATRTYVHYRPSTALAGQLDPAQAIDTLLAKARSALLPAMVVLIAVFAREAIVSTLRVSGMILPILVSSLARHLFLRLRAGYHRGRNGNRGRRAQAGRWTLSPPPS
jgi:hypothetical protein